jgi:CRISPR system Cascade subunit CasB
MTSDEAKTASEFKDRVRQEAGAATEWWRRLQPYDSGGQRNPFADRAALARLRRASALEAMSDPATLALFRTLKRTSPRDLPRVALCAAVLASIREDDPRRPAARQLGAPSDQPDGRPAVSALRFRRLVEAETEDDRLTTLRRAVALAGRTMNVRDIASACLYWTEPRRRQWIFDYYNAGSAAPDGDGDATAGHQPADEDMTA